MTSSSFIHVVYRLHRIICNIATFCVVSVIIQFRFRWAYLAKMIFFKCCLNVSLFEIQYFNLDIFCKHGSDSHDPGMFACVLRVQVGKWVFLSSTCSLCSVPVCVILSLQPSIYHLWHLALLPLYLTIIWGKHIFPIRNPVVTFYIGL